MRRILPLSILVLALGCTKRDVLFIHHYLHENRCSVVSVNADKQNTSDFYLIKTFGDNRLLTHFKGQVGDIWDQHYQFNYQVTYQQNKAILHGSTKVVQWVLDHQPEDPDAPVDPNAPTHPEENVELRDTKDIEILLDWKTHYPTEVKYVKTGKSLLKLFYDNRGFLNKLIVNGKSIYNVKTDNRGNILSILTPPLVEDQPYYGPQTLGVRYTYSNRYLPKGTRQYYETPIYFVSPIYSILEMLDWGPFQPDRERTGMELQHHYAEEYLPDPMMYASYFNHKYDKDGKLIKYDFEGDVRLYLPYLGTEKLKSNRLINWQCAGEYVK